MTRSEAEKLLEEFRRGRVSRPAVLKQLMGPAEIDLQFAKVDVQRSLRKGFPEVIYASGKTPAQTLAIARAIWQREKRMLITRASPSHARLIKKNLAGAVYHEQARCITLERGKALPPLPGFIAVVSAGTSDLPVAEEAAVTAEIMGNEVQRITDVGVAGLHRLLSRLEIILRANVVIAVAGMEGALPSVIAGLVSRPVIAVPTSIGYGASFSGLAALLAMLNSCGSGVTVVNIDNGFGAGYAAAQINVLAAGDR